MRLHVQPLVLPGGRDFNPRIRVGCDHMPPTIKVFGTYFNPRIRVGCDSISARSDGRLAPNFNPRIRVGCDEDYDARV